MDLDDLAKALKGSNVTINIMGGTNNEFYTSPVQVNQTITPDPVAAPDPACYICGFTGGDDLDEYSDGVYSHYHCRMRVADAKRHYRPAPAAKSQPDPWQVVASAPEPIRPEPIREEEPAPLQIEAPPEKTYFETIEERYADSYAEMRENARQFGMAQAEWLRNLSPKAVS